MQKTVKSTLGTNARLAEALAEYVTDLPQQVSRISALLATGESRELQRALHQLKGSGGGYGFDEITRLAGDAERAVRSNAEPAEVSARVAALIDLLRCVEGYNRALESDANPMAKDATPSTAAPSESERLAALQECQIDLLPADNELQGLATLATRIAGGSMAVIGFIGASHVQIKAHSGIETETWPVDAFSRAVVDEGVVTVSNTAADARFSGTFVNGLGASSLVAVPLRVQNGLVIGFLCVLDRSTRHFDGPTVDALTTLAQQAVAQVRLAKSSADVKSLTKQCAERQQKVNELGLLMAIGATDFYKRALDYHAIVAITDARGRICHVNDQFCQISKYSREELLGQDHRILNSDFHPKTFFVEMYRTIASGRVWRGEIRNRAKDGSLYWVDTTIVPFTGPDDKVQGYVAIRVDITGLKRIENELRESKEAAEVYARQAEHANLAKSEFLANMSHEIRTPMSAIIGYADLLAHSTRSREERIDFVQTIRRNGEHLLGIINDILDLSKIEAGKMTMERIPCSPRQVVQDVESLMRVRAEAAQIEFRVEFVGDIPKSVGSDPMRLRQVLLNLISNAIKFTRNGSVRLAIEADSEANRLKFSVIDTGIGLNPQQQANLFQPFAQADNSTTRRFGGTGLGLVLSKRIVEMLGGQLNVVSEAGVGSTFSFTIDISPPPLAEPNEADPVVAEDESEPHDEHHYMRGRVLVAEDGPDNRRLVTIYLEDVGLTVDSAPDGRVAVDKVLAATARGEPYDLVLMDMQMPELDGYAATRELRQRGFTDLPVVALTAHAMAGEREKCLNAGCDAYATKPIDPMALVKMIAQYMGKPSPTRVKYWTRGAATTSPTH